MADVHVVVLSGPESSRAQAEVALETARIPLLPDDHHGRMLPDRAPVGREPRLPLPATYRDGETFRPRPEDENNGPHGFISVVATDVNAAVAAVKAAGWVLRVHYPMPDAPPSNPGAAWMATLEARLAALEAGARLPPIGGAAVESPPWSQQAGSYGAEQTRRAVFAAFARTSANTPGIISGGLFSSSDMQLSAPGSGLSTNVSTGECVIGGTEGANQGGYYARNSSQTNLAISAASPSNPRIDTICATVSDAGYTEPTGGSGNQWTPQVVTGTPTSGATLSNLNGVASLPASSLLLGYVLVPTSATNIITADIANVASDAVFQFAPPRGSGALQVIDKAAAYTALNGQMVVVTGGNPLTITLPSPTANGWVGVYAAAASGASPITVSAGSGIIYGVGLSAATSFPLGGVGAFAVLQSDGTNWYVVDGQQDTGWVAITPASNWTGSVSGAFTAAYRKAGNTVRLRGSLENQTGSAVNPTTTVATSGLSLSAASIATAWAWGVGAGTCGIEISTSGAIYLVGGSIANTESISLDTIGFDLS